MRDAATIADIDRDQAEEATTRARDARIAEQESAGIDAETEYKKDILGSWDHLNDLFVGIGDEGVGADLLAIALEDPDEAGYLLKCLAHALARKEAQRETEKTDGVYEENFYRDADFDASMFRVAEATHKIRGTQPPWEIKQEAI